VSRASLLRALLCAAALGGGLGATVGCEVGVEAATYPVVDDGYYPAACIATTHPIYYNGFATYWCAGLWYYRMPSGRWAHYGREPRELYEGRMRAAPERRTYEHVFHPPVGGRPGGERPGGGGGRR